MILVDTSVWVEHLRSGNATLADGLDAGDVLVHPHVIGELACGNLKNRKEVLDLLGHLPFAPIASDAEALALIARRTLMGRGIGYVDVHLLASTILAAGARLLTLDRRLRAAATALGVGFGKG